MTESSDAVAVATQFGRALRAEGVEAGPGRIAGFCRAAAGGEPLERAWSRRRVQQRRVVFLLDVSGSMTEYSRALVMFAHAALRAGRRWEAFCFGTRLTRITRALAAADPDEALRRAAEEVV